MVKLLICALITLSFSQVVYLSPILNETQSNDMMLEDDDFEWNFTNQLMDEIKARILKSLDKSEAPKKHVLEPKLQTLRYEDNWENKTESMKTKTTTDFIYASVENISCYGQPCSKIHFNLQHQKDFQSAELWFYKKQGISEFLIMYTISANDEEGETITTPVYNQTESNAWTRFDVSHMVDVENITALEFRVVSDTSMHCLETEGDKAPFLLIHKYVPHSLSKRSAIDCTNETTTCCRQKYYVKFEDMGWKKWIIEPQGYEVNYCQGSCMGNLDLLTNHRARVLHAFCGKNPHKAREINKTECVSCTPTEYRSISIIYLDEQDIRIVSHLPDMSVTKCGCS